jgi:hypothetical protein
MDFRKTFDRIPEEFDRWRPRYCEELFADVIEYAKINTDKAVLEIGPGTGQATEPLKRVAIYCRVSTTHESQAESLDIWAC